MTAEFEREAGIDAVNGLGGHGSEEPEQADPTGVRDSRPGLLGLFCSSWRDVQQARLAAEQRGLDAVAVNLRHIEDALGRQVAKQVRQQPLWPWLSQFPGLGGVHTARLLVRIGDPWRFPGQRCTVGHYTRPIYAVGQPCPVTAAEEGSEDGQHGGRCNGSMLDPRTGTGTRSLWHFCGLHVVDGHSPRKTRGQRADWDPIARTAILQPGGIAEQIVRLRVPIYRAVYDEAKERLTTERGVADGSAIGTSPSAAGDGAEAGHFRVIVNAAGLRPIQIEGIARKIAAKAFVGDLLRAWKEIEPL